MDGIDACLAKIDEDSGNFDFEILETHSTSYPDKVVEKLLRIANNKGNTSDICNMDFVVGKLFAKCANELVEKANYPKDDIDCIATHGQTVFHIPETIETGGISTKSTLQIGCLSVVAEETGISTIGNFRTRDIAAGGQGAPLVPFADEKIFKREIPRAIQNIGGIANVTVLSPDVDTFAFDTGPGNMLIDYCAKKFFNMPYDEGGKLALQGEVDENWLNILLDEEYYKLKPPKTTGRELFSENYIEKVLASSPKNPYNIISTITALTARTIADAYKNFVFSKTPIQEIVLGGGGTCNQALINNLKNYLPDISIKSHADFGIDDKYKEALAFAFLGYCSAMKIPNNLPKCTGAKKEVVMGEIAY